LIETKWLTLFKVVLGVSNDLQVYFKNASTFPYFQMKRIKIDNCTAFPQSTICSSNFQAKIKTNHNF